MSLVVETGNGLANANSYVDPASAVVADYFGGHLYATAWAAASGPKREQAVQMATRVIDSFFDFGGTTLNPQQALQWPRYNVFVQGWRVPANAIPLNLQKATCEQALALLLRDRTNQEGTSAQVKMVELGNKALVLNFGDGDANSKPVSELCDAAAALLDAYGSRKDGGSGMRRAYRA